MKTVYLQLRTEIESGKPQRDDSVGGARRRRNCIQLIYRGRQGQLYLTVE